MDENGLHNNNDYDDSNQKSRFALLLYPSAFISAGDRQPARATL